MCATQLNKNNPKSLQQQLVEAFSDPEEIQSILETLAIVGVADNRQLLSTSGLSRDKLRRSMDKLVSLDFVHAYRQPIRRQVGRGRSPKVFRLEKPGAVLLDTRPSGLTKERQISHALHMLDVHLGVEKAGLDVITDQVIDFGKGKMRPDHLVNLPGGTQVFLEVEQDATPSLLRRLIKSLRNKAKFFASEKGQEYSPIIRMLVALPEGSAYQRTLGVWQQALDVLIAERKDALPFQLFALPLNYFLDDNDWDEPPDARRWTKLTSAQAEGSDSGLQRYLPQITQRNPRHDQLILSALLQAIHDNHRLTRGYRQQEPNPYFFINMQAIYSASHDDSLTPLQKAAYPRASLFLLKNYLFLHRSMRDKIAKRIRANAANQRWNTTIILHRMQTVVDSFLAYHGFRSDGPLLAYVDTAPWDTAATRSFRALVKIRHAEIVMPDSETIYPSREEIKRYEKALAWVFTALFRYAPDLGFKAPPFW